MPKGVPIFQLFFEKVVQFLNFSIMLDISNIKNIWTILENLPREAKNLNFDICKISLRKNLINLKPLKSFSMEHLRLTEQLFGWFKIEVNIFFYLPNFIYRVLKGLFRKAYIMHTINLAAKAYICKLIMKLLYCSNYSTRKHSRKKRKELYSQ